MNANKEQQLDGQINNLNVRFRLRIQPIDATH